VDIARARLAYWRAKQDPQLALEEMSCAAG